MNKARFSFMTALVAFLLMALPSLGLAQVGGPNKVPATLVAETVTPAAGSTITLAIRFTPEPGWHGYWQNPGDAGFGGKYVWTLPKGVSAGAPAYPVPTRLVIADLMNHVFEQEHALLVPLTIPAGLAKGTKLNLKLRGDWLGCTDEICVPQGGDMAIDLIVGDGTIFPAAMAQFDGWRAKLPRPLGSEAKFEIAGKRARFAVPFPESATISDPWLFAVSEDAVTYVTPQKISRNGDTLVIETDAAGSAFKEFAGVVAIGKDKGLTFKAVPGAVPAAGTTVSGEAETAPIASVNFATILLALGGALLGGLILNIMPCVFPIISLKALSLAKAGGDERAARHEALAYAAGVILVCVGLGAVLLGLRAGGSAVGWAFQLQEPRVILVLLVLVTGIAFNLAGLFELGGLSVDGKLMNQSGTSGAFWTGALAAFIATPCTGPFMGAALGAALVLPTVAALAIFAGLGLGMALPFLLLGYVPAFRRMLPKPGAWMETMRHILSIPMFLTALGLVWLLGRQAGVNAIIVGLAAAMVAAFGLWWFGRRQASGKGGGWVAVAAVAAIMAGGAVALPKPISQTAAAETASSTGEPFSETRLAALRAEGRPVFVYFTADWCLTCKVNEKAAIDRAETEAAFKAANVATLVGDWTNADATITRFLNAHGVSGVPLYLYYPKGGGEPKTLPQVLTVATLTGLTS